MGALLGKIGLAIGGAFLAVASWFGATPAQSPTLGNAGTLPQVAAWYQTVLSASIGQSDTSMTLGSLATTPGGNLPPGYYGFIIDSQNPVRREAVEGYVGTSTIVTGLVRGLSPTNPNVTSTAYAFQHNVGASVIISDYSLLGHIQQILNGSDTFPNIISYTNVPSSSFTNAQQIINKGYADSLSFFGSPNGSLVVKGIYQEATQAQMAIASNTGSTGADLINPTRYNSLTASTSPVNVIASGTLDPSFLLGGNYNLNNITASGTASIVGATTIGGQVTISSVTSSLLQATATGTIKGLGVTPSIGQLISYGANGFQGGVQYMNLTTSTGNLATSTALVNVATLTLPIAGSSSIYNFTVQFAAGGNNSTETSSVVLAQGANAITLTTVTGFNSSNNQFTTIAGQIYMQNSASSMMILFVPTTNTGTIAPTASANNLSVQVINMATTTALDFKMACNGGAGATCAANVTSSVWMYQ